MTFMLLLIGTVSDSQKTNQHHQMYTTDFSCRLQCLLIRMLIRLSPSLTRMGYVILCWPRGELSFHVSLRNPGTIFGGSEHDRLYWISSRNNWWTQWGKAHISMNCLITPSRRLCLSTSLFGWIGLLADCILLYFFVPSR